MKVCHVISSLEVGGAQQVLIDVCSKLRHAEFDFTIISLTRETDLARRLRESGLTVHCLDMKGAGGFFGGLMRLTRLLRAERPDLVQTWLYHADLLGGLAARLTRVPRLIWSVHHANPDFDRDGKALSWIVRILARLSGKLPDKIVYCSGVARQVHHELGYRPRTEEVIHNGIDLDRFRPDPALRHNFRQETGLTDSTSAIGIVGRYAPVKGYDVFLDTAQLLNGLPGADFRFVMAGTDVVPQNASLAKEIAIRGLTDKSSLLGERSDVEAIMNGIDLLVCPSYSESFGLVVIEAIACGTEAVASDLAATRELVDADHLASVAKPEEFMERISALIDKSGEDRTADLSAARKRIEDRFSLTVMSNRYRDLYLQGGN